MRRILKGLLWLFLIIIGMGVLLILVLNTPPGRKLASDIASEQSGRTVRLNGFTYPLLRWPLTVRVQSLQVENPEGMEHENMADIGTMEISVALGRLLQNDLVIPRLMLSNSELHLERTKDGKANWILDETTQPERTKKEDARQAMPDIRIFELHDAEVTYKDTPQRIDVMLHGKTEAETTIVTGNGIYQGQSFKLHLATGEVFDMQKTGNYPVEAEIISGHTRITAKGTATAPGELDGIDLALTVQGADASDLYPITGIALLPTPPYKVSGKLGFDGAVWSFNDFKGTLGGSDISGDLKWDTSTERPKLTAAFTSNTLQFADLGPLIGLPPEAPKSKEQKETEAKQEASPRVIPDVKIDLSKLSTLDADVTFTGKKVVSPTLPLDDFHMHLVLENRQMELKPVKFGTANGDVAANILINARKNPPAATAEVDFTRLSLARLTEGIQTSVPAAKEAQGIIGGKAKIKGNGQSLHELLATANGDLGIGMEGGQLSNLIVEVIGLDAAEGLGLLFSGDKVVPIHCIVADFGVMDGQMQSRNVVVDTQDTNIEAKATIDLGTEEMDITIIPHPKDMSLASLRTPLRIGGTFKEPALGIDPSYLIAKGGAAAALSVVLTPIAGVLALIEPGMGEDSNCVQLLRSMNQQTGTIPATDNVPVNPVSDHTAE